MRTRILFLAFMWLACNQNKTTKEPVPSDTTDSIVNPAQVTKEPNADTALPDPKTYANARFRNVTVERLEGNTFRIRGQGQIFEASFSWVVEDGHYELYKGYQMTDAGAPEWGNFDFTIDVQKKRENSTLTLILFESSPKDGSRQYELPVTLY